MAAADASFKTSTDSISLVSNVDKSPVGNPSTTYKGLEAYEIELIPLMVTIGSVPGLPLFVTWSPGTRPCNACCTLTTGSSDIVLAFTLETAPVTDVRFWVPYPTTTTSPSTVSLGFNEGLIVVSVPTVTSSGAMPIEENTRILALSGTVRL